MERPILIYFLLPFSILSIILYIRIIILAWRKSSSLCFNSFFFRQTRTQVRNEAKITEIAYFSGLARHHIRYRLFSDWTASGILSPFFVAVTLSNAFSGSEESVVPTDRIERHDSTSVDLLPYLFVHSWTGKRKIWLSKMPFQSYGIALIALNRMLLVCAPTSAITMVLTVLSSSLG